MKTDTHTYAYYLPITIIITISHFNVILLLLYFTEILRSVPSAPKSSQARRMSRGKSYLPTHTVKSFHTNVCCVTSDKSAEFLKSLCPALRRLSQIVDGSLLVRLFEVCVVLEPQLMPGAHLHDWPVIVHFHGMVRVQNIMVFGRWWDERGCHLRPSDDDEKRR